MQMRDALAAPQTATLDLVLKDFIDKQEQALRADYLLFEQYYRGEQRVMLTDRLQSFLNPDLKFRDNYCGVVVDVLVERLEVIGFDGSDDKLNEYVWQVWQANRMDQTQITAHLEAVQKGDGYILVSWNKDEARPMLEFQNPDMIIPHYNPATRKIDWASKKWVDTERLGGEAVSRLNLYFPDRIEKYFAKGDSTTGGGVWRQFQEEDETEWPQDWTDGKGDPIGVAIQHFRNLPGGDDFGVSELTNIVPLQDLLNKSLVDLMQILDIQGYPQRATIDLNTPNETLDATPGAVWNFKSTNPDEPGTITQFDVSDIDGPLRTIETIIQHISSISRTPQHLFQIGGDAPSGEALKVSESGLVFKVKRRQVGFGNTWEDSMRLAAKLEEVFGEGAIGADDATLSTMWQDPETRNEKDHLEGIAIRFNELGIPRQQAWREAGYTEPEIETMLEEKEAERATEASLGQELLRGFSAGGFS